MLLRSYLYCLCVQDFSVESAVALTLQEVKNKYKALLVIDCPPEEELPPGLKVGGTVRCEP